MIPNDERRLHSAARPQPQLNKAEGTSGSGGIAFGKQILDVEERLRAVLREFETARDVIETVLAGALEELQRLRSDRRSS